MSRFSRAEAESRGWTFVHETQADNVVTSSTQGESRFVPASIRAEKYVQFPDRASQLVNVEGETEGLVLERIAAYEAHLDSLPQNQPAQFANPDPIEVRDDEGNLVTTFDQRTVRLAEDPTNTDVNDEFREITDAEYSAQGRQDVIVDSEGQHFFGGPTQNVGDLLDRREELSANIEAARTEAPAVEAEQVQVVPPSLDAPGSGAGGLVIVRAGEHISEVPDRREQEASDQENLRVQLSQDRGSRMVPPAGGKGLLAGTDAGLGSRGDLESEIPSADSRTTAEGIEPTSEAVIAAVQDGQSTLPEVPASTEVTQVGGSHPDALPANPVEARQEAQEEAALEARDEDPASADKDEGRSEVRQAGAEAEQEAADALQEDAEAPEAEDEAQDTPDPVEEPQEAPEPDQEAQQDQATDEGMPEPPQE